MKIWIYKIKVVAKNELSKQMSRNLTDAMEKIQIAQSIIRD
jgi:hypothetical protein